MFNIDIVFLISHRPPWSYFIFHFMENKSKQCICSPKERKNHPNG